MLGKSNSECGHDRGYRQMPQHHWGWFSTSFMCLRFICKPCIVRCCLSGAIALLTSTFELVLYRICIFPIASNHHLISSRIFICISLNSDNFKFYFTFHVVNQAALERSLIIDCDCAYNKHVVAKLAFDTQMIRLFSAIASGIYTPSHR